MNTRHVIDPPSVGDVALHATGLVAGYGDLNVVHGVDLEVRQVEIVALLGSNASGKTTTLLTLAGELPAHGGGIEWYGGPARGSLACDGCRRSRVRPGGTVGDYADDRAGQLALGCRRSGRRC